MDFNSWLSQVKIEEPELSSFITKLESCITDSVFKGDLFNRRVSLGLTRIDSDDEQSLIPEQNVED